MRVALALTARRAPRFGARDAAPRRVGRAAPRRAKPRCACCAPRVLLFAPRRAHCGEPRAPCHERCAARVAPRASRWTRCAARAILPRGAACGVRFVPFARLALCSQPSMLGYVFWIENSGRVLSCPLFSCSLHFDVFPTLLLWIFALNRALRPPSSFPPPPAPPFLLPSLGDCDL